MKQKGGERHAVGMSPAQTGGKLNCHVDSKRKKRKMGVSQVLTLINKTKARRYNERKTTAGCGRAGCEEQEMGVDEDGFEHKSLGARAGGRSCS